MDAGLAAVIGAAIGLGGGLVIEMRRDRVDARKRAEDRSDLRGSDIRARYVDGVTCLEDFWTAAELVSELAQAIDALDDDDREHRHVLEAHLGDAQDELRMRSSDFMIATSALLLDADDRVVAASRALRNAVADYARDAVLNPDDEYDIGPIRDVRNQWIEALRGALGGTERAFDGER